MSGIKVTWLRPLHLWPRPLRYNPQAHPRRRRQLAARRRRPRLLHRLPPLRSLAEAFQPAPVVMTPPGGVAPAAVTTVSPAITSDIVQAAARSAIGPAFSGMLTADSWNYYYSQVSGVHQTANLFLSGNRGQLIDVNTYFARRRAAGLTGLGNVGPYRVTQRASKGRAVVMLPSRGPWLVPPSAFLASPTVNPWAAPWRKLSVVNPDLRAASLSGLGYDEWLYWRGAASSGMGMACDARVVASQGSN